MGRPVDLLAAEVPTVQCDRLAGVLHLDGLDLQPMSPVAMLDPRLVA